MKTHLKEDLQVNLLPEWQIWCLGGGTVALILVPLDGG